MREDATTNRTRGRSTSPVRLPPRPTRLIGRESEMAALSGLLLRDDIRLVTITGPPGVGKTRLAIEVADGLASHFADGVLFVDLSTIRDPKLVPQELARGLGIQAEGRGENGVVQELSQRIETFLEGQRILLLLDNFEHVLEAAPLIGGVLAGVAVFKVLATSRIPLHLLWEHEFALSPLALPGPEQQDGPAAAEVPAIALYLNRARMAAPRVVLDSDALRAVVQICRRLDGLPLAIELAAARSRMLPPALLLEQLAWGLDSLPGEPLDLPERQRTLQRALAWSYDLLQPHEQSLFRHLAVFAGGFTAEAAQAVWPDDRPVLPILATLTDQHLVYGAPEGDRFHTLESLREFALARLENAGESAEAHRRHARHFMGLAEQAESALRGPDQLGWLSHLDQEHQNFQAALHWCVETGEQETGLRIASGLWRFWDVRASMEVWGALGRLLRLEPTAPARVRSIAGVLALATTFSAQFSGLGRSPADAIQQLEKHVELLDPREDGFWLGVATRLLAAWRLFAGLGDYAHTRRILEEDLARARAGGDRWSEWHTLGTLRWAASLQGKSREAADFAGQRLAISRELGDTIGAAANLRALSWHTRLIGDYEQAVRFAEEALTLSRAAGWQWSIRRCITSLGAIATARGDYARAEELFQERLRLEREAGDPHGLASALNNLAILARWRGDHLRAREMAEDSLQRYMALSNRPATSNVLLNLGLVQLALRDVPGAARCLRDALVTARDLSLSDRIAEMLGATARVAKTRDDTASAARLLGAKDAFRQSHEGIEGEPDDAEFEGTVRKALGSVKFEVAKAEGAAWPSEQAIEVALDLLERASRRNGVAKDQPPPPAEMLTRREIEVAGLVTHGLPNREIAKRLFISERTADTHIQHILNKLGFSSRSQIAAWVVQQRLRTGDG